MIFSFFARLRAEFSTQRIYRRQAATLWVGSNLRCLRHVCLIGLGLMPLLLLMAFLLVPEWHFSVRHGAVLILCALFFGFATFFLRSMHKEPFRVLLLCAVFCVALPGGYVACSAVEPTFLPVAFFALGLLSIPVLFDFPFSTYLCVLLENQLLFLALDLLFWPKEQRGTVLFLTLCAFLFSVFLAWELCRSRARHYLSTQRYRERSRRDGLTGILNKSACEQACRQYLSTCAPTSTSALFMMDLDSFKGVNDTYGHQAGDKLLEAVGDTLGRLFRSSDLIGRFGGDEFCVFMKDVPSSELLRERAQNIVRAVEQTGRDVLGVPAGCSIGIAVTQPGVHADYESLLHVADEALYAAKKRGKHCWVLRLANESALRQYKSAGS